MGTDKRLIAMAAVMLILIAFALFQQPKRAFEPSGVPYIYTDGKMLFINTTEECRASGGACKIVYETITYVNGDYDATFFARGTYKGKPVGTFYFDGKTKQMEITRYLNPSDGTIQGNAVFSGENGKMKAMFYLDEDWKKKVGKTWLLWGKNWENEREFVFTEVLNGLYSDNVEDSDISRFRKDYHISDGNFAVTDASGEEFRGGKMEGKTAIIYS